MVIDSGFSAAVADADMEAIYADRYMPTGIDDRCAIGRGPSDTSVGISRSRPAGRLLKMSLDDIAAYHVSRTTINRHRQRAVIFRKPSANSCGGRGGIERWRPNDDAERTGQRPRNRINPLYAATGSTESYERRICAGRLRN